MGSWWTQGDPRTPWGLGCLKTPRSWWTQGDPGAPGVWECPRTPGPGAAFLQDCQPCCVEAQPRPPWGPWPRPPWGPWVVSALGPGLWLRHRPSWPQPQDMCPAGPPGQSAWQRWADMPPSRHCREPFSPQCWGAAGGGPRPVRVPAVSGACSLHKALACTRPLVVLYFAVFICMYRVFVMRQRLHLSPLACGSSPGELVGRLRSRRLHSRVGCPWTALCILGWTSLIKGV